MQRVGRSLRILLFDSFLPRTLGDNRAACPVVDFVPKVRLLFGASPTVLS